MSESANAETEVAFLRSQVTVLSNRLCETLTQQVAQQQTVLIASMQANLALTQTIDRLNKMIDSLAENLEILERNQKEEDAVPAVGTDWGTLFAALAPHLLGAVTQPKPDLGQPKEPVPFTLPREIVELMRLRKTPQASTSYQTGQPTQTAPVPGTPAPTGKAQAKKTKPNS